MDNTKNKFSILPIFLVVFIDMLGIGIIIPIMAPLLLNDSYHFFSSGMAFASKTIVLGLLLAIYPLTQFFGAPILGSLSDKHGRKKMLILSLFGTFIGYILFAIGIYFRNIPLLFISRAIDGFTGGNISIAMSSISDISNQNEKVKRFGLIGMAFGLGIIIGPFVGGKLADPNVISWFNHTTPFWFAALLCLANIILFIVQFQETLIQKRDSKISLLTGFRNIYNAFHYVELKKLFIFVFIITLGFNFFTQFFQVYLIDKFQYTEGQIGNLFAYLGVWIALTQGLITRPLSHHFSPQKLLAISTFFQPFVIFALLLPTVSKGIYWIIPLVALTNGITFPNITALISNSASKEHQGEILGINQSLMSLGMSIPPIISGFVVALHPSLPIIISSSLILIGWAVFVFWYLPNTKKTIKLAK